MRADLCRTFFARVYRHIGTVCDGSHFFSVREASSDRYRAYLSDERRRNEEKWPRPAGLRGKSGHTSLSALKVGPPHSSASASSGRIFSRNADHSYVSIHPRAFGISSDIWFPDRL